MKTITVNTFSRELQKYVPVTVKTLVIQKRRLYLLARPNIQLLNEWGDAIGWAAPRNDGHLWCMPQRIGEYAIMSSGGHRLFFYAPSIDAMPDDVVQDIIAYELAHVCQIAEGDDRVPAQEPGVIDLSELDANELIDSWSFDPDSVDVWEAERRAAGATDMGGQACRSEP